MSTPPGQVFTPTPLADHLWRAARRAWQKAGGTGAPRVIEPAAGDGALLGAIQRHARPASVTAIELDPAPLPALHTLAQLAPPSQQVHIVHADALGLARGPSPATGGPVAAQLGIRPSDTPNLSADAPLLDTGWADIVIANPPYLRETGNAALFRALRAWHNGAFAHLYRKDADLHHFFWDIALRWLRPGGVLAFLTPAYFLESESAAPLRQQLSEQGHVIGIYRAQGTQVFAAGVEAAVTLFRKGPTAQASAHTALLDATLNPTRQAPIALPRDGSPWWLNASPELDALQALPARLGELYSIREGVSTGANRLRKKDAERVPNTQPGHGILVLSAQEAAALQGPDADRLLARRHATDADDRTFILRVFDGDLPRLDKGEAPRTPLEHHLTRFRPILEARAEIQRNPARSWYALAWPRPELGAPGAILTPKWSKTPAFAPMQAGRVPMTDFRILVPRTPEVAERRDAILAWLLGPQIRPWYAHRLKKKGVMTEWYGAALADIPLPALSTLK